MIRLTVATVPLALCLLAGSAMADELPSRKAGLWEVKMSMEGRHIPAQTMQQCIDATTDQEMRQPPGMEGVDVSKMCSKRELKRAGDTMTMDSICTFSGKTSKTHMVINGSFDSAYTMKVSVSHDEPSPHGDMVMSMDAKWLGACKPDQKPGDLIMPGGMKININDMKKMRAGGGTAQPGAPGR